MYLEFYGLREEPFRLTPDPSFLHLAEPHRAVLIALLQGIINRRGFLVFTGPIGTGKTTLLHTALRILTQKFTDTRRLETAFVVNPTLTREELLESILDEFEVRCLATSKPRRLLALHEHLLEAQRRGSTSLLIIDEAHLLTMDLAEELRLLSNLDGPNDKLLQIVLTGQPEFDEFLAHPHLAALQQRIAVRKHLRPLTLPEVRLYIAERMKVAGLGTPPPFSEAALDEIERLSHGIPRVINLICENCLMLGFEAKTREIGTGIVEQAALTFGSSASGVRLEAPSHAPRQVHRHWR